MTNVQTTSLFTYMNIVKPTLGKRQRIVLEKLQERENMTNLEIAESLNLPINSITPRVFELRKLGYVYESKRRVCKISGYIAIAWMAASSLL